MNRYHHHHRRGPSLFGELSGVIFVAGLIGAPFYALWHPLGVVVALVVFGVVAIPVCLAWPRRVRDARRGVAVRATATARVRRG